MKRVSIILLMVVSLFFFTDSCKKKVKTEPVKEPEKIERVEETTPRIDRPVLTEEEIFEKKSLEELNAEGNLRKIHFDFDKYDVKDDMKPILHRNADWLLKHGSAVITIEGHCDERGTIEYNMALGEKRAKTTRDFLESLGVTGIRMQVVSYGKNKPIVRGVDEQTHYRNRRCEFVIIRK
ncbi:MAG: peptidoglycan-associated lipoprotein Pal [Candidatus Aminicenantes bacterium]|nr:peptidoglycan-associated lipoprotein Pal [Candidatus Aminicenantes bacterium]